MAEHRHVAVLFADHDSIYKKFAGCDVWDQRRDACRWPGGMPVIAHPPCRSWGGLRALAKPEPEEQAIAMWAVAQVQRWGGVLEHPKGSLLWPTCQLPMPNQRSACGGYTLQINQSWFGFPAIKPTWLYIVGCPWEQLPAIPLTLAYATHTVGSSLRKGAPRRLPEIPKKDRARTTSGLAEWLIEVAVRTSVYG